MILLATRPEDYRHVQPGALWRGFTVPEGGLEPPETLDMLVGWCARLQAAQGWGTWLGVAGGEVVASLAVKDPAQDGSLEIGYGVAPARRGRGFATLAVRALLPMLRAHGVGRVLAETARDNQASARVLVKAGFTTTGVRLDPEDGLLDLWSHDFSLGGNPVPS